MMSTTQTMKRTLLLLTAMVAALMLSSTVALAITKTCEVNVTCVGTVDPDTLNGTSDEDDIFGRGAADTLKGFGLEDELFGERGPDKLFGGPGIDKLIGGPANDALSGGADFDHYYFGPGWGKDTITDSDTPANRAVFYISPNESLPVSDNLTIKLAAGEGPEVKTESGTNTINWESNVIEDVQSGTGDDQITGNYSGNEIIANAGGADTIYTAGGDDLISVNDGEDNDVVDCGENGFITDNDRVLHDPGDQIADNCEIQ